MFNYRVNSYFASTLSAAQIPPKKRRHLLVTFSSCDLPLLSRSFGGNMKQCIPSMTVATFSVKVSAPIKDNVVLTNLDDTPQTLSFSSICFDLFK